MPVAIKPAFPASSPSKIALRKGLIGLPLLLLATMNMILKWKKLLIHMKPPKEWDDYEENSYYEFKVPNDRVCVHIL